MSDKECELSSDLRDIVVVLRCPSSARFLPEQGHLFTLHGVAGFEDRPMEVRMRTRWSDEGHDAPLPKELWIEVRCRAASLDAALPTSSSVARYLSSMLAFTANVQCGVPEVHLGYDASKARSERDFVQVFLQEEQALPRHGRAVKVDELTAVFQAFDRSPWSGARLTRALHQYELALRHWYFGGEYLALAHLYMAVETLTKLVIRFECAANGIDEEELARRNQIDPDDPDRPRWRPALEAWVRREVIFESNLEVFSAAKAASDGFEHGFLEINDVVAKALSSTAATFTYVRHAMLRLLQIDQSTYPDLFAREPRDVQSMRKMIRGRFVGDRDDPQMPGDLYPHLIWRSRVAESTRNADEFKFKFTETFTVRCHPEVSFEGIVFEARGRLETGNDPVSFDGGEVITKTTGEESRGIEFMRQGLTRALGFAAGVARAIGARGMTPVEATVQARLSTQLASFEAVQLLLSDNRSPEALAFAPGMIRNTSILQLCAAPDTGPGVAIRAHIEGLEAVRRGFSSDEIDQGIEMRLVSIREHAASLGVEVPDELPDLSQTDFHREQVEGVAFVNEVARFDLLATNLHVTSEGDGPEFRTQAMNRTLEDATAALAIAALVNSAEACARACGAALDLDRQEFIELLNVARDLEDRSVR